MVLGFSIATELKPTNFTQVCEKMHKQEAATACDDDYPL
jgi:hypothetical protein